MKLSSFAPAFLGVFLLAPVAYGQTSPAPVPRSLSLSEAIRTAIDKNYLIKTTQGEQERAELEKRRSNAALLPDLDITSSYGYSFSLASEDSRTFLIGDQRLITPPGSNSLSYNLGSGINLFAGGGDAARIRGAEHNLEAAKLTHTWTRQEIAYNVTATYINALRFRELVQSATQTLAEGQAQLERTRGLYEAGSIAIGPVYQQEAVVGQNELAVIQAQNNYDNAKADLLLIINLPPSSATQFDVNLEGLDTSTSEARRAQVEKSVSEARFQQVLQSRPDLVALRERIEAGEATVDVTRSFLLPRIDANVGFGANGSHSDLDRIHFTNRLNGGLSLSIPIFDRMQNRLAIEQQEIDIEISKLRLQQEEQAIRSDIAKSQNNLRSAERALESSARALRSAEESLRLAQERLRVGAGIQVDVVVAQSQLEAARTNRVNAVYNYILAQKQIEFTLGQWSY